MVLSGFSELLVIDFFVLTVTNGEFHPGTNEKKFLKVNGIWDLC